MNELISVIIPIYKVEDYLKRCVNSLLNQTYRILEIILVDDGSPDRCGEICDEYKALDNRIKVIHKKNGGLSDARNAGIEICKGKYITFVDSDDWVHEMYIENLYKLLIKTDSDMSVCNFIRTSTEDIKVHILAEEIYEYSNIEALEQFLDKFYVQMVIACGKLFKRSLFKEIRFPVGRLHEDEFTTHKLIFNATKIVLTTAQLYYYWQREDSIMGSGFNLQGMLDKIDAMEERGRFFDSIEQIKLRNRTFRNVFYLFKEVNDRDNLFNKVEDEMSFKKKFKKFKQTLRKTNQGIFFWMFYQTYCITPKGANGIFSTYIDRKYILNKIKLRIISFLRPPVNWIRRKIFKYKLSSNIRKKRSLYNKCIFLMATPCHGNLGDHAIVYAEYKFLNDMNLINQLIEIKNYEYLKYKDIIKKYINKDDVIIIDGGGNLGTLWPHEDDKISEIIESYINNRIIVFPQTCFYSNDFEGKERIKKSIDIYSKHKDLTITLRDKHSYEFICRNFPTVKSIYVPDIVLYINNVSKDIVRSGVLLCFRKDLEKVVTEKEINKIKEYLKSKNISYIETDTIINKEVTKKNRNQELSKKWNEFSKAGLVITDRLHGMIFATITGTPCIAIDNKSKKVSGVYNWISSLEYIKICDDILKVKDEIQNLYKYKSKYNRKILVNEFNKISMELEKGI